MIKEYFQNSTKAYFSVKSISVFIEEAISEPQHTWFTILICTNTKGKLTIDDSLITINKPQAIFITPGQYINFSEQSGFEGYAISFNQEFYCIEYHDSDVSCKGLLFVNNYTSVHFALNQQQLAVYLNTAKEMIAEMDLQDKLMDEMLKNLLKNLLIRSNRLFREQMCLEELEDENIDFARKFSDLVEKHYKEINQVEAYAGMMNLASASLTKKLQKYGVESPLKIIRARKITEAKRLLLYTDKSIKEIAAIIGYEDQFYFSRLFTKETGQTPSEFKKTL